MIALANTVSYNFFPIILWVLFFFPDETLRHSQMFQRKGESECQNHPLGFSGLWVTLKEFSPISYTEVLKIMREIHLTTKESKPHLVWQINASKNIWSPNYGCFRGRDYVFHFEMGTSLWCVYQKIKQFTSSSSSFSDHPLIINWRYSKT